MLPAVPGRSYPRCVGGRRAGPPQDWAGPLGYLQRTLPYQVFEATLRAADIIEQLLDADEAGDLASVGVHRYELVALAPLLSLERFDRLANTFTSADPRAALLVAGPVAVWVALPQPVITSRTTSGHALG